MEPDLEQWVGCPPPLHLCLVLVFVPCATHSCAYFIFVCCVYLFVVWSSYFLHVCLVPCMYHACVPFFMYGADEFLMGTRHVSGDSGVVMIMRDDDGER